MHWVVSTAQTLQRKRNACCTRTWWTVLARRGQRADAYPELLEAEWVGAHPRLSIAHLQTLGPQLAARPVASLLHDEDLFYKADRRTRSAHRGPEHNLLQLSGLSSSQQFLKPARGCELIFACIVALLDLVVSVKAWR